MSCVTPLETSCNLDCRTAIRILSILKPTSHCNSLILCYLLFSSAFAGWIDWNLLVDYEGGPNHLGNMCDAPIVTLEDFSDVHVQPKYYYFGHISKFVPPGSVRVESHTVGECGNRYAPIKMRRDDMT